MKNLKQVLRESIDYHVTVGLLSKKKHVGRLASSPRSESFGEARYTAFVPLNQIGFYPQPEDFSSSEIHYIRINVGMGKPNRASMPLTRNDRNVEIAIVYHWQDSKYIVTVARVSENGGGELVMTVEQGRELDAVIDKSRQTAGCTFDDWDRLFSDALIAAKDEFEKSGGTGSGKTDDVD